MEINKVEVEVGKEVILCEWTQHRFYTHRDLLWTTQVNVIPKDKVSRLGQGIGWVEEVNGEG